MLTDEKIEYNYYPVDLGLDWKNLYNSDGNKPADGANKREIFAQNAAPTSNYKEGDLWFDADDNNTIYRANSALSWVSVKDGTIAGKTTTFRQAAIPTSLAAGDLWYDSDDSDKQYRAAAAGATTIAAGAWVRVDVGANPTLIDALATTNAPAAAGADVTSANTAAAIAGQGALATLNTVAAAQIDSGAVTSVKANLALRGWTFTGAFSASDADTVAWATGTFTASDGTAYSITGANTGNMAALTYIYLDIAVSTTAFQTTTTAATAVGNGKVLVAIAQNQTSRATFQVFGGSGGNNLLVDNLVANSASTNEFVSNTAQLANLVVTNAKINDLAVSKLTAGSITSKAITLAVADGTGDAKVQAGKTDFTNTENGFILGIDDSDSDKAKFYIGDATNYLNWNGTNLILKAVLEMLGTLQLKSYTVANLPTGNTGWKNPSGNAVYSGAWTNPENAYSSDDSRATGVLPGGSPAGRDHKWNTFGFSIPANSTITGIEVKSEHYVSAASATYYRSFIYSASAVSWSTEKNWTQQLTESYETLGSSSDLWGTTWTVNDFSDANFAVRIYLFGSTAMTAYVDNIQIRVHYSDPANPLSAGAVAYASNGRKNGEGVGVGTGVLVFYDGSNWIACDTGQTVAA